MRTPLITCLLLIVSAGISAQVQLTDLDELLIQYGKSNPDTNRVRILLKIDTLYLYRMPDTDPILDSAALLAEQAKDLSTSLGFEKGYDEAVFLYANSFAEKSEMSKATNIMNSTHGELRVHILIMLSERYIFRPGRQKRNIDSAYTFIIKAKDLSDSIHSPHWRYESLCILGKYYYALGNPREGEECFLEIIRGYHREGNKEKEASWWFELAQNMPDTDSTYDAEINANENSLALYRQLNKKKEQWYVLNNLACLNMLHGNLGISEQLFLEAIKIARTIDLKHLSPTYVYLSELNLAKGDYRQSLYYALEAKRSEDSTGQNRQPGVIYFHIAEAYKGLGETEKSLEWYFASLNNLPANGEEDYYSISREIAKALIEENKPKQALSFFRNAMEKHIPDRYIEKEIISATMGDCYNALGNYERAERNYQDMLELDTLAKGQQQKENFRLAGEAMFSRDVYYLVGKFYIERKKFETAASYLRRALVTNVFPPPITQLRDIQLLLFRIDSAKGDYIHAIQHLETRGLLNDSVFNVARSRQIEELQIQYESEKKEKDIQVLKAHAEVQEKELQRSADARKFVYLLVAVLVGLLGVGFSRYRLKQKTNDQLRVKQNEINLKNLSLEHLVREKEWLVREIHHRVKNNFHIVMGLLGTQSNYLKSDEAINAMTESQNRVQAMSLIHQKLYQSDNLSGINMSAYIHELVDFLADSLDTRRFIKFNLQIEPIELHLSHCVPLGLIMNEAITNSIKYAFPNNRPGTISIALKYTSSCDLLLTIRDNGVGLPPGILTRNRDSFGLKLMRGLSEDIEGKLTITEREGTEITLAFEYNAGKSLSAPSSRSSFPPP